MTSLDHIWINANPEYRDQLRRANEARAAAYYAAWRTVAGFVGNGFHRLVAAIARARRARRTYRELSALSDRQLNDIGLWRSELPFIAEAVAAGSPQSGATLADLPRLRSAPAEGVASAGGRAEDTRRGRPRPWAARPPKISARRAA